MTDDQPDSNQEPAPPPEGTSEQEQPSQAQQAPAPEPEEQPRSREDALAEVRQSLREEEQAKKPGFFARLRGIFRRRAKEEAAVEEFEPIPGFTEPAREPYEPPIRRAAVDTGAPPEVEAEPRPQEIVSSTPAMEQPPAEPPVPVFTPGGIGLHEEPPPPEPPRGSLLKTLREEEGGEEQPVDYSAIRGEALEGYVEQPQEPVAETPVSMQRTMRRTWRSMRPVEKAIITGALVIIIVAILIGGGFLLVRPLLPAPPVPTSTPGNLPYPMGLSLPGGWDFTLGRGVVQDAKWEPARPEWLEGTEVCRWVSLPWNVQLEAVLRTLKANDEITLTMSNYDKLIYKVRSIEQVPADQLQTLQTDEPCLLVILSKEDSNDRWVVTSNP